VRGWGPDGLATGAHGRGSEGAEGVCVDYARNRAEARHARILDGEVLDRRVGVRELLVEVTHDGEERRDHREQAARQGQAPNAVAKTSRTAGRDVVAVLAEQGPDDRDVARARVDQGPSKLSDAARKGSEHGP
jgi:hypothetical protein